jgi:hypothetical protein
MTPLERQDLHALMEAYNSSYAQYRIRSLVSEQVRADIEGAYTHLDNLVRSVLPRYGLGLVWNDRTDTWTVTTRQEGSSHGH